MIPITKKVQISRSRLPQNQEVTIDPQGKKVGNFSPCGKCGAVNCCCK